MNMSMNALNSLRTLLNIALFAILLLLPEFVHAQCATDLNLGQNLVVNGDFSNGYSNWTFDAPYKIKGGGNSNPTDLQVGTNPATFNTGGGGFPPFDTYGDHTTGSGNFLMVDGYCSPSSTVKVWSQTVNVVANTNYYFSVWISSLKDMPTNPGNLNFNIGGSDLGSNILAPTFGGATASNGTNTGGGWIRYVIVWNSGATSGPVALSIQNNNLTACGSEVDFGLDDIAFTPGCDFGSPGPQPNLGVDRTLCGTGGSITLNAGVPMNATTTVSWSDGTTNTGSNPAFYSKVITTPGTYSVCVSDNGSCTKSDVIVITNTFTPTTSPNANLCVTGGSAPLDAVFTGIGATYQWKLNGTNLPAPSTNRTYTATTAGTYTVDVSVPGCGTVSSGNTVISSSATAAPTTSPNANLCTTNPAPLDAVLTGTGITYQWKLNGVNLPAPSTNRTYSAISPGNYTVDVRLPGCTTTTSGTTVVSSTSPVTPVDAFYCANTGSAVPVTLGATGTNSATFKWYTASTGGSAVNTGASYGISIPDGTTGTQTYYVQDETVSSGSMGPSALIATGSSANAIYDIVGNGYGMYFSATQNFKINSFQMPIRITSPTASDMTVSFNYTILKGDGSALSVPITGTTSSVVVPRLANTFALYTFNLTNLNIPFTTEGSTFQLRITGRNSSYGTDDYRWEVEKRTGLGTHFPYASNAPVSGVASITNSYIYGSQSSVYSGLYNWNISAQTPCSRVPVRAISNCPTPVTWTSFYLVPQDDNSCKLVWSTADETNNAYFAVERSVDGINFETIATISGAGNRDIASNYFYVDNAPLSGTSYYRITQHDFDGKFSSTAMKPYSSLGLIEVTTYPNPFQNNTTLLVSGADAATYSYTLYSVNGQLVEQGSGTMNQTQTIGEAVAKGMYMLKVVTSTDIVTTKIVKQ